MLVCLRHKRKSQKWIHAFCLYLFEHIQEDTSKLGERLILSTRTQTFKQAMKGAQATVGPWNAFAKRQSGRGNTLRVPAHRG
jgi:hypothetical protein